MTERIVGKNYNANLETKEITALVKKQIKQKYNEIKVSGRTSDYNSIWIKLKLDKDKYRAKEYSELDDRDKKYVLNDLGVCCIDKDWDKISAYLNDVTYPNKDAREIERYARSTLESYNYDGSDPYTDYFDFRFYGDVQIEWI